MSVFSANMSHRSYWWQISALCFVLGLLLAAAWNTAKQLNRSGIATNRVGFSYGNGAAISPDKVKDYEREIKKKSDYITELENKLAKNDDASETLNKKLQDTKVLAGLTEVEGSGIQVTLQDSQKPQTNAGELSRLSILIHDEDIYRVVNEMKACGAEVVAVNGQRVVASTAIRCLGPVISVNDVRSAPPVIIQAIGNPDTLFAGLNMRDGVLDEMRRFDPNMVRIEKKKLRLPAFSGSTTLRYALPPKSSGSKDQK